MIHPVVLYQYIIILYYFITIYWNNTTGWII